jgi:hypothetical protein
MSISAQPIGSYSNVAPLVVTRSPAGNATSSGSGFSPCGNPGTTGVFSVTPTGGLPPYTYLWERVDAVATSGPYIVLPNNTARSVVWRDANNNVCANDSNKDETWRCTVTDSLGTTGTVFVVVVLSWVDLT